jgi:hypothetical protein
MSQQLQELAKTGHTPLGVLLRCVPVASLDPVLAVVFDVEAVRQYFAGTLAPPAHPAFWNRRLTPHLAARQTPCAVLVATPTGGTKIVYLNGAPQILNMTTPEVERAVIDLLNNLQVYREEGR